MSGAKLVGLIVLGLLLFGVVGAANAVTTAERTVLDADYVDEQLESGGAYESIRETTIDAVVDRLENANLNEGQQLLQAGEETDNRSLVADAITEEYIQEQTSDNIRELYAYLHGEQDSLGMEIDMQPLKDNLADSFAAQVDEKNTSTLVEEFGPDSSQTPVPIDGALVEQMRSSPEGYEQARLDFRVDLGFEVTDNDEKLYLIGEDPRQYSESEKEQIVRNREQEIRNAIRQEIQDSSSQLSSRVRQEVQQRRGDAKDRICESTVDELNPDAGQEVCSPLYEDSSDTTHLDNVTYAAVQLQYVIVDGLTREQVQYDYNQFNTDLTQSEDHLSTETGDLARDRIEQEVPDTLNASDQFGSDATTQFENAQRTVGIIDTVYLVLPVVALLLIGLAFVMTRSLETTATFTGIVLALVGGLYLVGTTVFGGTVVSEIESAMQSNDAPELSDIVVTLVESILGVLTTQSAVLLVVGIALIVLSYLSKSGRLPVSNHG